MSAAEIADNRWEVSASKAPITSPAGIGMLLVMSGFGLFFVWIMIGSVQGIIMPKGEGLAGEYKNLNAQDAGKAETPAE